MTATDAELVAQACAGEEAGYRELVLRYQRPVLALIVRMVKDRGWAEDLAQESFVKAFRALESFQRDRKFSSWLFKIANNTAIDALRRKRLDTVPIETSDPDRPDLLDSLAGSTLDSPETSFEGQSLGTALAQGIDSLRPEYRTVIQLRFIEGLAYDEIAEVMGLALGTVKTHLHRARKALARRMEEEGWAP